jgi:hypothetical protein
MTTATNTSEVENDTSLLTDDECATVTRVVGLSLLVHGATEKHNQGDTNDARQDLRKVVDSLKAGGEELYGDRQAHLLHKAEELAETLASHPSRYTDEAEAFHRLVNLAHQEIVLSGARYSERGIVDLATTLDDGASADIWYGASDHEGAASSSALTIDRTTSAMTQSASLLRQVASLVDAKKIVISPEGVISVAPDQKLLDAAERLVSEFHVYGEVLQFGEGDDYGSDTAVGELQLAVEAYGRTFPEPVPDADASDDDEPPSPKG